MITAAVQRWRDRRDTYRPRGETIVTREYEVRAFAGDTEPKAFVEQHHYSGTFPAACHRFGLHHRGELVGVAVVSVPMPNAGTPFAGERMQSPDLGRFVLLDSVPANGETWFLARCIELLRREDVIGLVSLSDPAPRTNAGGAVVFGGHIGTIYQALSATYLGRGERRTLRLLPDGTVFSARAISKIRARERGWRYAAAVLEAHGADRLTDDADARAWLALWLPRLTRTTRHPGHHRYAIPIDKRARRALPASQPYPKLHVPEAA